MFILTELRIKYFQQIWFDLHCLEKQGTDPLIIETLSIIQLIIIHHLLLDGAGDSTLMSENV